MLTGPGIAFAGVSIYSLVVGFLLPVLTDLITKSKAGSTVKAIVNLLLAAAGGVVVTYSTVGFTDGNWRIIVTNIAITFGTSLLSFFGVWKPTGTSDAIQKSTPKFGIGPASISDAQAAVIKAIVAVAKTLAVDPLLAICDAFHESGWGTAIIMDSNGYVSVEPFCLNYGPGAEGAASGLSPKQAQDPTKNAQVALANFAKVRAANPTASPGEIAAWAEDPADQPAYIEYINELYNGALSAQGNEISDALDDVYGSNWLAVLKGNAAPGATPGAPAAPPTSKENSVILVRNKDSGGVFWVIPGLPRPVALTQQEDQAIVTATKAVGASIVEIESATLASKIEQGVGLIGAAAPTPAAA